MSTIAIADDAMEKLITKACGARSMTEFAKACGISPMHISRIKSGNCTPSKKMCIKLGNEPYVKQIGLSSRDFLEAAGYRDETEIESTQTFEQVVSARMDIIAIGIISKKLLDKGINFQMLRSNNDTDCDFAFHVQTGDTTRQWNFVLCNGNEAGILTNSNQAYYFCLGRLFTFKPNKGIQYTLLLDQKDIFQRLLQDKDSNLLHASVSVALVDANKMEITEEFYFGSDQDYLHLLTKM